MFSPTIDSYTYISRAGINSSRTGYVSGGQFIESDGGGRGDHKYYSYRTSAWNSLGLIPIIRSISGTLRACLGVADVITGIALSIFQKNTEHMKIAQTGAENIVRGAVEVSGDAILIAAFVTALSLDNLIAPLILMAGAVGPSFALGAYYNTIDPKNTLIYEP